jgi:transcriptional regulator with XRE-family HTH domain
MPNKFGDLIAEKRKEQGVSLRGMAEELGIAAPYLSDIEKGRRNPPNIKMLEKIISILKLTDAECDLMFDYAGDDRKEVSPDLPDYIMDIPEARTALRKAKAMGKDAQFWVEINKKLDEGE